MTGLVGELKFDDTRIGDRGATPADLRPSEYGGVPGEMRYPGGPQPNWAKTPTPAFVKAIGDGLRRATGRPTDEEIEEARRIRAQATISPRSDQRLAAMFADAYVSQPDAEAHRAFQGTTPKSLPRDPDLRWVAIGKAAIDTIHRHVDHGSDHHLSPEIARQARLAALGDIAEIPTKRQLAYVLHDQTKARSDEIRNYLGTGPEVDAARNRHASLEGRDPAELERRMAEARLGLVAPKDIVFEARAFAADGGLPADQFKGRGVVMPDPSPRIRPDQRDAAVGAEIARARSQAAEATPDRNEGSRTMPAPARAAAVAAARGQGL